LFFNLLALIFFDFLQDGCTGKKQLVGWNKLDTRWLWDNVW